MMNENLTILLFQLYISILLMYSQYSDGISLNRYGSTKRKAIYAKSLIDANRNRT